MWGTQLSLLFVRLWKGCKWRLAGENEIVDLLIYENENYTMTLFLAKASIFLSAEISGSCLTVLPRLITSLHHPNGLERLASRTTPP